MLSLLLALVSSLFFLQSLELLVLLGFLIPLSMMYLYKTNVYMEDMFMCINDMNGMLVFLTLSLTFLILLSSWSTSSLMYNMLQMILLLCLLLCFSSNNLLMFYVYFESSLVPILIMIISWGYQPERLQAGMYMIMYTVLGSMPLLFIILYIYIFTSSFNLYYLFMLYSILPNSFFYLGMMAFLAKLPMYSLHLWLPKAHVEAPLGGSMILAGVLLKLGGYGLYIYSSIWIMPIMNIGSSMIMSLSMWGGFMAALMCMCQSDIKAMIAYSSIVHMTLVILGCLSGSSWGISCALLTMIAHGWASSALFFVAFVAYEKLNSRSFLYTSGMLKVYPVLSIMWFSMVLINMAVPPSINFMGELFAVPICMWINFLMLVVLLMIMFMSVAYNMYLYTMINHGAVSSYLVSGMSITSKNMLSFIGHMMPMALILSMNLISLYTVNCMWYK